MFKIYKKEGNNLYEFTDFCGKITLRSSNNEISEQLSFSINGKFINEADIILLYENSKKIYEGIVIDITQTEYTTDVNVFDFGWYLNQNQDVFQFNNPVSQCIRKILNDYEVPIGSIINIPQNYKGINKGNLNIIIEELMEYATKNNGIKYFWQMRNGKFYLEKENDNVIIYKSSLFGSNIDITKLMSNPQVTKSIANLKNAVKVVNEEQNSINVFAYRENSNSIKKYGKIQLLERISAENKNNAANIANNKLKLLNKVENTLSVELPGVIDCKANKVLQFDEDIINIKGKFRVKQCNHIIQSPSYLMALELEMI